MIILPEQKRFFEENGYIVFRQLIEPEVVEQVRQAVIEVVAGDNTALRSRFTLRRPDGTEATQLQQLYRAHPILAEYTHHPKLGAVASQLMGNTPEVRLWHDQVIHKPPKLGGAVNWHQDYFFWQHVKPSDMVTSWTALSKVSEENGCVHVIPGSHKWGLMENNSMGAMGDDPDYLLKTSVKPEFRHLIIKQPLALEPGDVSFHHCMTLHGSYPNRSDSPRIGYTLHYFPAHARYVALLDKSKEHEVQVADGELIRGDGFPVLWSSQ